VSRPSPSPQRARLHFAAAPPEPTGWIDSARQLGPLLLALPLAAFAAAWMLAGAQQGDVADRTGGALAALAPSAMTQPDATDGLHARFGLCSGPVRETCVVDGDTLWLAGTKIRVADIDAPEVSRPGCAREAELGAQATQRFMALLNAGAFTLAPDPDSPDTDRYGRSLRLVTRGGESLGGVLVDEGLAERWGGPRIDWC